MLAMLVNLDVDDLERALEFYVNALGLEPGRRLGPDVVELLGASSPMYLLRKAAGSSACPGPAAARDYARHWTPVHLDFVVPELAPALARALAAGAVLERPTETAVWGRIAGLVDPFGHGLCLIEFLNRGYDELT